MVWEVRSTTIVVPDGLVCFCILSDNPVAVFVKFGHPPPFKNETLILSERILARIEELILEAERKTKPLELDPYRSQLFELFVAAVSVRNTAEGSDSDLSADGLCRYLGTRWGIASAAREAISQQSRIPQEHLAKMRLMWSAMRMWMEWNYAWERWPEFHGQSLERVQSSPN